MFSLTTNLSKLQKSVQIKIETGMQRFFFSVFSFFSKPGKEKFKHLATLAVTFDYTKHKMLFASLFVLAFIVAPHILSLSLSTVLSLYSFVFLLIPFFIGYVFGVNINGVRVVEHSTLMKVLNIRGLAIYPVVFVVGDALTKKGNSTVILRHERIHLEQQREMFILPFYIIYLVEETLRAFFQFSGNWREAYDQAYLAICFEREAYGNEAKGTYLRRRVPYAWTQYYFAEGS